MLCTTRPSPVGVTSRAVHVSVTDRRPMVRNQQYKISGTSEQSHLLFNYVEPTVSRVTPRRGFRSGSTSVTLVGRHLDVGSNFEVSIAGNVCQLQGCVHKYTYRRVWEMILFCQQRKYNLCLVRETNFTACLVLKHSRSVVKIDTRTLPYAIFFRIRYDSEIHCLLSPNISSAIEAAGHGTAADRVLLAGDVIVKVDNAQLATVETFSFFDKASVTDVHGAQSIARSKNTA